MTAFRVGEVVSVEFLFTDTQGRKRRPGLVLAVDANDLLLSRITTHEPRDQFDVRLDDCRHRAPKALDRQAAEVGLYRRQACPSFHWGSLGD